METGKPWRRRPPSSGDGESLSITADLQSTSVRPSSLVGTDLDIRSDCRMKRVFRTLNQRGRGAVIVTSLLLAVSVVVTRARLLSFIGISIPDSPVERLDTMTLFNETQCTRNDFDCVSAKIPVHPNAHGCNSFVFSSHHKTGHTLSLQILRGMCPQPKDRVRIALHGYKTHTKFQPLGFLRKAKPSQYVKGKPFVHFIRDPLETVVSAYQYHLVSDEKWLRRSGYQERLRNATVDDGVEMEFHRSVNDAINKAVKMHEFLRQPSVQADGFTVRMEQLRDEFEFRATVYALEKWLRMPGHMSWELLQKCCYVSSSVREEGQNHVSKVDEKDELRKKVMSQHGDAIRDARRRLGFPQVGLEILKQ